MTTDDRTHEQIRELLAAVALDAADAADQAVVRAHVAACEACRDEFRSLESAAAAIGLAAGDRSAPALGAVRSRLLARIADEGPQRAGARAPRRPVVTWWAAAASIALVASLAALMGVRRDRDALRREIAEGRAASVTEIARLRDSLSASATIIGALTGPGVEVVNLAATGPNRPTGRMFWDQVAGRWTLIAHGLPALPQGRTYQLWVITTAGERVSAGTFDPVAGRAIVQATYALARGQLGAVAVTEEPAGGAAQPTGSIVIAGSPG